MTDFIELRSGPASEYPVFHVVSKGQQLDIVKTQTNWYQVITLESRKDSIKGWVHKRDIASMQTLDGQWMSVTDGTFEDYQRRNFEISLMGGLLDKTSSLAFSLSWVWTKNLALDLNYSQALGDFSDNKLWSLRMRHTMFPNWKLSPYLGLAGGSISTTPNANLVQSGDESRRSNFYESSVGLRYFVTENTLVKIEYRGVIVNTDRDEQQRLDNWLIGASFFF